jgi:hypothetical protein
VDDLSINRATLPTDPDERETSEPAARKRARPKPGPAAAEQPPTGPETPAHDGRLDVVV